MAIRYAIPQPSEPIVDGNGHVTRAWRNYLSTQVPAADLEILIAQIEALAARVEALEADQGEDAVILGPESVEVAGQLSDGLVQLRLVGDEVSPLPVSLYSTDDDGEKGWSLLYPNWVPNPYADYLVDENGDYLVDENGNFLTGQDGFPIPLEYGGTGADNSSVAANLVWASPDAMAGVPVFRVLVGDDVPDHNDVNGIQGGTTDEYYHLTAAEHALLSAAASGSPVNVTGSRGGNAALASLLTAIASLGFITDSTTA
jgi:hypothetical protein